MGTLEDLIGELRDQGREEEAGELEKLKGSTLRDKAKNADRFEKELEAAKAEIEGLKRGPKVREAFEKAGVNFDSLSKLERRALSGYDGEIDEDAIADFLEENEIDLKGDESDEEGEEASPRDEEPAAAKVAKAARTSGARKTDPTKITPADAAGWSNEKRVAFLDEHPNEYEALLRGETVTGVKVSA